MKKRVAEQFFRQPDIAAGKCFANSRARHALVIERQRADVADVETEPITAAFSIA